MTDRYIDAEETQVYGPYAAAKLRELVRGRIARMDDAVVYAAEQLEAVTAALGALVGATRTTDAAGSGATATAVPLLEQAHDFLVRFSSHLDATPSLARRLFFTKDGTVAGVGRSGPMVLLAVQHIGLQLASGSPAVPDAATWRTEAESIATGLSAALATSGTTRATRHEQTPAVRAARAAWLTTYVAAKSLADSVLRLSGHLEVMRDVFYDLQVPSGVRAVDAPPPAAPAATPAAPAAG